MSMQKALVSGATGFVGTILVQCLKELSVDVCRIGRSAVSNDDIVCDFLLDDIPKKAFIGIDTVFHLAGYAHDMRNDSSVAHMYQRLNVDVTVKLAEQASLFGVKRFVFVSSVKAGGSSVLKTCVSEMDQGDPEGIYGQTKREAELKILEIGRQSNMHVSIIRPSLVYGPKVKGNLAMMQRGIQMGWFPPLPDTGNQRSMIHVDDLVRAIVLVAESDQANGEIYIATDGRPYSSRQIYEAICHSVEKDPYLWSIPRFFFDLAALMSSKVHYKLNKLLGDECYSSIKLELLGFKAQKTLMDFSKSDFSMGKNVQ